MKKLLLLSVALLGMSCSNDSENCEERAEKIMADYERALWYAGNSQAAINRVNQEYNERFNELYLDCNDDIRNP